MPGSSVVDLSNSFGAAFIGLVVCMVLFGLALGQTWLYYWNCWDKDTKALKSFIAFIITMDIIHTAMVVYSIYWYLVQNFSNVEALAADEWFFIIQGNFGGIYSSAVQWYYARQIYLVSKRKLPVIIIVVFSIAGTIVGFYTMSIQLAGGQVATRFANLECLGLFGTADCVVVDVLITTTMCWALYRNKTGARRTDSIIMTLMAYTINTGLLTTLFGVAMTLSLYVAPRSLIPMAIYFPMGKCYVNSVLAMLNSRNYIRERGSAENSDNSFNLSSIRVAPPGEAFGSKSKQTDISVIVRRSVASVHGQNGSDLNTGHAFEVPKPDTRITSPSLSRISVSSM